MEAAKEIYEFLPHAGTMCLIDSIDEWDEKSIVCHTRSHLNPDNPMRFEGRLYAVCGIEYGAQAAALHGALVQEAANQKSQYGYLISVQSVLIKNALIDDYTDQLTVSATRLASISDAYSYEFALRDNQDTIMSGNIMVKLV